MQYLIRGVILAILLFPTTLDAQKTWVVDAPKW